MRWSDARLVAVNGTPPDFPAALDQFSNPPADAVIVARKVRFLCATAAS
jgi:hypothetical protein